MQTANRLAGLPGRTKALLVALALALVLAVGLAATTGAQPAEAYEKGVCKHDTSIHRGPDGRYHGTNFLGHYTQWNGARYVHTHKMSHWTKRNGDWHRDWIRYFECSHSGGTA